MNFSVAPARMRKPRTATVAWITTTGFGSGPLAQMERGEEEPAQRRDDQHPERDRHVTARAAEHREQRQHEPGRAERGVDQRQAQGANWPRSTDAARIRPPTAAIPKANKA